MSAGLVAASLRVQAASFQLRETDSGVSPSSLEHALSVACDVRDLNLPTQRPSDRAGENGQMTQSPITIEELRVFILRETPKTFDLFKEAQTNDNALTQRWCRGRIDAMFQVLRLIDRDSLEAIQAEWRQVLGEEDWTAEVTESN